MPSGSSRRSPAAGNPAADPEGRTGPAAGELPWTDLYDYGVIGNLRTAALVSRAGSIDWACFPEFQSPSLFGRLLDRRNGGHCTVAPIAWQESLQRYTPGTNVLSIFFTGQGGTQLVVSDFMPIVPGFVGAPASAIVRRLSADRGQVEVRVALDPRFDYGRARNVTGVPETSERLVFAHGPDRLTATAPWPWEASPGAWVSTGTVRPGHDEYVVLEWGAANAPYDPAVLYSATVRYWRDWVRHPDSPLMRAAHVWRDWVERSELLLKLLSDRETGAFVAAPTTSLPEWWLGPRNWDYRYAWVRDAAFAAQSLFLLGHVREARTYVEWIVARLRDAGTQGLATMYRASGRPVDDEVNLPHWEGHRGSRPVRIGNAAGRQTQLDIYGEVLDAVGLLERGDPEFVQRTWPILSRLVEAAAREWKKPDAGIWESRGPHRHYVHSKVMCWVALDRGHRIAHRLGRERTAVRWRRLADEIHATVLERGFDARRGTFVQAFDEPELDASVLRIPMTGFLPFDDPRVISTVRTVEVGLAQGPFVYRNRVRRSSLGPEGAFLLCSFWLVECLARCGERERAVRIFRRLLRTAGPLRLFPEEYDPATRRPLGNYPQAFTHIGVLRAALAIGAPAEPRRNAVARS